MERQWHRAEAPDWRVVPVASYNPWQRLAAASNGFLTPGNAISLIGAGLVGYGLECIISQRFIMGLWLVIVGRLCDGLDGLVADATGTKSPIGEAIDAGVDKILIALTLLILLIKHIMPWPVVIIMAVHTIYNVVIALTARERGRTLHPSPPGKISAIFEWLSVAFYILAYYYRNRSSDHHADLLIAALSFAGFVLLAGYSSLSYSRQLIAGAK